MPIEMPEALARGPVGSIVGDRYRITSIIGEGSQGVVCRAEDSHTGGAVAIKLLAGTPDQETIARFMRERDVLIELEKSNVVRILDTVYENRTLYLVMELLDGKDLQTELEQRERLGQPLAPSEMLRLIEPIVDTLDAAHARGIFHRDLKPANIFVLRDGGVRLLDFGLCRLITAKPLTELGTVLGSPSYIAPEAWRGTPQLVGASADVYALGVTLFRMLAGRLPFASESVTELLELATSAPRPSPRRFRPELPEEIDGWVEQALAIRPEHRFRSVRALYNALVAVLGPPLPERHGWFGRALHALGLRRRRTNGDPAAAWKARVRSVEPLDPVDELLRRSYERSRRR